MEAKTMRRIHIGSIPISKVLSSVPRRILLIAAVCGTALVAMLAWLIWPSAQAQAFTGVRAARIERVDGSVRVDRVSGASEANEGWVEASRNTPLTTGNRVVVSENGEAAIAL